ncbi:hypothetical protein MKK88_17770 [Methylobacterium sp. E-005]|uniref:hypothetical protein n=1 Tax=Methylobacterium sp. E-005 TaxID=2836549 RepID=UPI001FBA008F|nr:hypothetical protein [Methylobacterium sp. E-005]MCJ2087815.1 hypothetical protein [Methylobacterium sp. E-005]
MKRRRCRNQRGADRAALDAVVDRAGADLDRSPEILTIDNRWFLEPVPPHGLDPNLPLCSVLRWAFEHSTDASDPAFYAR